MARYAYVSTKPWDKRAFQLAFSTSNDWRFADSPEALKIILSLKPEYIFFKHWPHRVAKDVLDAAECVCFHATDLPFGRGGSPIQNLIAAGHRTTKLTALRMTEELDAGPIYLKQPASLEGSAQDIFERMATLSIEMALEIVSGKLKPTPQIGTITVFKRRTPAESEITASDNLEKLYDKIRMLDAETYPNAFLRVGDVKIELKNARLEAGQLFAEARFLGNDK